MRLYSTRSNEQRVDNKVYHCWCLYTPFCPLEKNLKFLMKHFVGFTQMQQSAEAENVGSCLYTQFDEGLRESIAINEAQEKLSPWGSPLFGY